MKFYTKVSIFLTLMLFTIGNALAWEQSYEGHPYDETGNLFASGSLASNGHGFCWSASVSDAGFVQLNEPFNGHLSFSFKCPTYSIGPMLQIYDGSGNRCIDYYFSSVSLSADTWHRIEYVGSSSGISLYVDGIFKQTVGYSPLYTSGGYVKLGVRGGGYSYTCYFDDLTSGDCMIDSDSYAATTDTAQYYTPVYSAYTGTTWYAKVLSPYGSSLTQSVTPLSENAIPNTFLNQSGTYLIKLYQNDSTGHGVPMASRAFTVGTSDSKISLDKVNYAPGDTMIIDTYSKVYSGYTVEVPYYDSTGKLQTYTYDLTASEQTQKFTLPSTARGGSFVIAILDNYGGVRAGKQYNVLASGGITDVSLDKTVYAPLDVVKISYSNMPSGTTITIRVQNGNSQVSTNSWAGVAGSGVLTYTLPSSTADNFIVTAVSGNTALGQTTGTIISGIYYLSGNIVNPSDGSLIPGATITVGTATTISDLNGHYNFTVPAGWQALTVSKIGYMTNSNKVNIVYKVATQDFYLVKTYSGNGHSIYGLVADYYTGAPVSSALITLKQGSTTHTLFSYTGSGYYAYDAEDMTGNWTVTVTKSGYYTYTGTVTISGDTYKQINLTPTKFSATGDTGSTDSSGGSSSGGSGGSGSITNGGTSGSTDASTIDTTGVSQDRPGREAAKGAMEELEQTIPSLIGITVVMAFIKLISS